MKSVKYLGLSLSVTTDYLNPHEREMKAKAARNKGMVVRQTLWTFNQYEVLRVLWKMVAVLGLTYAKAVLCLSTGIREFLERRQIEVGRMALGTHQQTPVEAIQGQLCWSTFTAREAVAKAAYENRLLRLPQST